MAMYREADDMAKFEYESLLKKRNTTTTSTTTSTTTTTTTSTTTTTAATPINSTTTTTTAKSIMFKHNKYSKVINDRIYTVQEIVEKLTLFTLVGHIRVYCGVDVQCQRMACRALIMPNKYNECIIAFTYIKPNYDSTITKDIIQFAVEIHHGEMYALKNICHGFNIDSVTIPTNTSFLFAATSLANSSICTPTNYSFTLMPIAYNFTNTPSKLDYSLTHQNLINNMFNDMVIEQNKIFLKAKAYEFIDVPVNNSLKICNTTTNTTNDSSSNNNNCNTIDSTKNETEIKCKPRKKTHQPKCHSTSIVLILSTVICKLIILIVLICFKFRKHMFVNKQKPNDNIENVGSIYADYLPLKTIKKSQTKPIPIPKKLTKNELNYSKESVFNDPTSINYINIKDRVKYTKLSPTPKIELFNDDDYNPGKMYINLKPKKDITTKFKK